MFDRIRKIVEYSGLNQAMFAEKIAVAPATLSNILKSKSKPSLDLVVSICAAFPEVNNQWLIFGKGNMLDGEPASGSTSSDDAPESALGYDAGDLFSSAAAPAANPVAVNRMPAPKPALNAEQLRYAEVPGSPKDIQMVKIIDKPLRKVREIQVFYDDDTYEVFVPRK